MSDIDGGNDEMEFYDEPVDDSVWGWEKCYTPCPECGGQLKERVTAYVDLDEIERVCMDCEYSATFYDG